MQRESVSPLITLAFNKRSARAKMQAVGIKMKCMLVCVMHLLINSLFDMTLFSFAQFAL